jgi:tetratricopeptide (TPR) repeat protein
MSESEVEPSSQIKKFALIILIFSGLIIVAVLYGKVTGREPIARSLGSTARFFDKKDMGGVALPIYHSQLFVTKILSGPNHEDTASCQCNLGAMYHREDPFTKAESYYTKGLATYEKARARASSRSWCFTNLAALYRNQGMHVKSAEVYLEQLEGLLKEPKPKAIEIAICLEKIARDYNAGGMEEKAALFAQRAVDVREEANLEPLNTDPPQDPAVALEKFLESQK